MQPLFSNAHDSKYVINTHYPPVTLYYHSKKQQRSSQGDQNSSNIDAPFSSLPLLFADNIWPGSLVLADYICHNPSLIESKFCLELGAAYGLPSLVACHFNAKYVVVTDYPAPGLLENIKSVFNENHIDSVKFNVSQYIWGDDPSSILNLLPQVFESRETNNLFNDRHSISSSMQLSDSTSHQYLPSVSQDTFTSTATLETTSVPCISCLQKYDVIFMAELLWKDTYSQQQNLCKSIKQLLHFPTGIALLSFAHRPSHDGQHTKYHDLEFLDLVCGQKGLFSSHNHSHSGHSHENENKEEEDDGMKLKVTLIEVNTKYSDVCEYDQIEVFLYKLSFI